MNIRSNFLVVSALVMGVAFVLTACGKGDEDATATTSSSLMSYVPEDTPYLAGNLEPVPEDVVNAMFERFQPVLDAAQKSLAAADADLATDSEQGDPGRQVARALISELDGKLNRAGLESLGMSMQAHQVVYGLGTYPVARIELGDAQALRDTIARIEAKAGTSIPVEELGGQAYWKLGPPNGHVDQTPVGFYAAIIDNVEPAHLALGVLPTGAESDLLPRFLGQVKPATDTATPRLAALNREFGYTAYGTGFVDFQRLFDHFTNPESEFNRALGANSAMISEKLGEVCQAEIRALIDRAPRAVAGTTEMSRSTIGLQYRLSLADDLSSDLAKLVSNVPAAPTVSTRLVEFAFGIRFGAARDFLLRKATEFSQAQYQCEALQPISAKAAEALTLLNRPMPPLVNNFLGIRASIDGMPAGEVDPSAMAGTLALHVDKPEMFVGMAQMFLPGLEEFKLVPGDPPVPLPEGLLPMPGIVAYAAMSDSALGLSVGQGEDARLLDYLSARSANDGSFLSVNYDLAAYLERIDELTGSYYEDANFQGADGSEHGREVAEAMRESFRAMAGRSWMDLRFDEDGFALNSRMTFPD